MELYFAIFFAIERIHVLHLHDIRLILYYFNQPVEFVNLYHIQYFLAKELREFRAYFCCQFRIFGVKSPHFAC